MTESTPAAGKLSQPDASRLDEPSAGEPTVEEQLTEIEQIISGDSETSRGDSAPVSRGDSVAFDEATEKLVRHSRKTQVVQAPGIEGEVTSISWMLPADMSIETWASAGVALGQMERAVGWWIGDWWIHGEHLYGDRVAIVRHPEWRGPSFETCMNYGSVSRAFETSRRREVLSFSLHMEVCKLPPEDWDTKLDECVDRAKNGGKTSTRDIRQIVKRDRRATREHDLGEKTRRANERLDAEKKYGVLYADPPWRFEPRSRETGMDRSPDNHYPTMTLPEILSVPAPAADDCVLFLWATVPMLREALQVMDAWGFEYKSHIVWRKDRAGTGYWVRCQHELLLIGTRGAPPAPAPGEQPISCQEFSLGGHSEKPDDYAWMIEAMFPTLPRLEMFARGPREGWDVHGNESEPAPDES